MSRLCLVVPSASPVEVLRVTLPSMAAAADEAGLPRDQVTIVDDRPEREGLEELVSSLGLRMVSAGGAGRSGARNLGAAGSEGDWILFIDDDVVLDRDAVRGAQGHLGHDRRVVIGGLRPPAGTPRWLRWTYEDATLTPASGLAPAGPLPLISLSSALALVPRALFERAGGFPEVAGWGGEDALLGLAIGAADEDVGLLRDPGIGGVHLFEPTWADWLLRRARAGEMLAELEAATPGAVGDLRSAFGLTGGLRARVKRAAGYVPPCAWVAARGRFLRRLAAAAVEARAYRLARRASDA